jgi:hypothetical protein
VPIDGARHGLGLHSFLAKRRVSAQRGGNNFKEAIEKLRALHAFNKAWL